ncbi:MAG: PA0069 family radical SAM protein [Pseudomonadota bacterium]
MLLKGRGAQSNPAGRFQRARVEPVVPADDEPAPERQVRVEKVRSVIATNRSPDVPFDQSINPYRGCEHGCIYCFARPSHAFLDLSPGLDFETRLFARSNAAEQLERELSRPSYRCRVLAIGPNTDAYQPIEKRHEITRQILEVCLAYRQPVALITKSALILRDLDLLAELAEHDLVTVTVSLTSLDRNLKRTLEPRAADHGARLGVLRKLAEAGVPRGVLLAPVIPRINDHEIEPILEAAAAAGAQSAGYVLLRLPHEVAPLFEEWLETHYPERKDTVLSLIRQCRDGALYRSGFGKRMRGSGHYAEMVASRVTTARRRFGLADRELDLDTTQFRVPGEVSPQLSLF